MPPASKPVRNLTCPLPRGIRVVSRTAETLTIHLTLPVEVAQLFSEALEIAARTTQSDRPGALIAAIAQEFLGTWMPAEADRRRARQPKGSEDADQERADHERDAG